MNLWCVLVVLDGLVKSVLILYMFLVSNVGVFLLFVVNGSLVFGYCISEVVFMSFIFDDNFVVELM